MAGDESGNTEKKEPKKRPSNPWEFFVAIGPFLKDLWNNNLGGLLFLCGLILVLIGAVGKVPFFNIDVSGQVAFKRVLYIGGGLGALGGIIWFFDKRNSGKKLRVLRTVLPIAGLCLGLLVLAIHYRWIPWKWLIGSELDDAVLALAVATLCGFTPAFLSADKLDEIAGKAETLVNQERLLLETYKAASAEQLLKVEQSHKDFLEQLQISEKRMVRRVEDATRTMLEGFNAVFDKASFMIKHAEQELIFVNFAMNFGSAHWFNGDIKEKYKNDYKGDFEDAVSAFTEELYQRIASVPIVKILTVKSDKTRENFLDPLSRRDGYEDLQAYLVSEKGKAGEARAYIQAAIDIQVSKNSVNKRNKRLLDADSLPIQLLITKMKDESGSLRWGCLVFMVGTDMLQAGLAPGGEPAFYTELDDMVDVFKNLAGALILAAENQR